MEAGDVVNTSQDRLSLSQSANTKSVQELHSRNNELQNRIGNLEQILMARINDQKEPAELPDQTMHAMVQPLIMSQ